MAPEDGPARRARSGSGGRRAGSAPVSAGVTGSAETQPPRTIPGTARPTIPPPLLRRAQRGGPGRMPAGQVRGEQGEGDLSSVGTSGIADTTQTRARGHQRQLTSTRRNSLLMAYSTDKTTSPMSYTNRRASRQLQQHAGQLSVPLGEQSRKQTTNAAARVDCCNSIPHGAYIDPVQAAGMGSCVSDDLMSTGR